jgi:hypothetical protein
MPNSDAQKADLLSGFEAASQLGTGAVAGVVEI